MPYTNAYGQLRFTPEERARALDCAEKWGPVAAGKLIGAHPSTVSHWLRQAGRKTKGVPLTVTETAAHERLIVRERAAIEKLLVKRARQFLEDAKDSPAKDRRDLMVSVGIALDKLRAERGETVDTGKSADPKERRRLAMERGVTRNATLRAV